MSTHLETSEPKPEAIAAIRARSNPPKKKATVRWDEAIASLGKHIDAGVSPDGVKGKLKGIRRRRRKKV